jgi:hypothetical protein
MIAWNRGENWYLLGVNTTPPTNTPNTKNMKILTRATDSMKANALKMYKGITIATVKTDIRMAHKFDSDPAYIETLEWLVATAKRPWNTLKK